MAPLGNPHAPHKGFGLALFVDVLAGVLSGSGFARGVADGAPGNLLWALDVEAFMPREEFLERMDAQIDQVKGGERLPGVEELVRPGRARPATPRAAHRARHRSVGAGELAAAGYDLRVARGPSAWRCG